MVAKATINKIFIIILFFVTIQISLSAQKPAPSIPVELLFGNNNLNFQMLMNKSFNQNNKLKFFGLATYTANYEDRVKDNSMTIINQVSYSFGQGFGIMGGAEINSFAGISPVLGPQHVFANKKFLAVTVASYYLNEENDFSILGLYEYKPPINDKWTLYSRLQIFYNQSLSEDIHNKSFIYLRAGLKRKSLIFGLGTDFDWSGPNRSFQDNFGGFIRWEFHS